MNCLKLAQIHLSIVIPLLNVRVTRLFHTWVLERLFFEILMRNIFRSTCSFDCRLMYGLLKLLQCRVSEIICQRLLEMHFSHCARCVQNISVVVFCILMSTCGNQTILVLRDDLEKKALLFLLRNILILFCFYCLNSRIPDYPIKWLEIDIYYLFKNFLKTFNNTNILYYIGKCLDINFNIQLLKSFFIF